MARRAGRKPNIDLRPIIEYMGLESFIQQVGVERIIEQVGVKAFIKHFGIDGKQASRDWFDAEDRPEWATCQAAFACFNRTA